MKKNIKEFVVKENNAFRIRVESWECAKPEGLFAVNFHNDCFDKNGNIEMTSTYNFFLSKDDMKKLAEGLAQ
jgi:hypothetical protein